MLRNKILNYLGLISIPRQIRIDGLQHAHEGLEGTNLERVAQYYWTHETVERIAVVRFGSIDIIEDGHHRAYFLDRLGIDNIPVDYYPFFFSSKAGFLIMA